MKIIKTDLPEVLILEPNVYEDSRGYFMESYNESILQQLDIDINFIQDNQSLSVPAGTLRGLHYQLYPKAQTKLVRVVKGAIYDVAVDIRKDSPNYGKWVGVILSEQNKRQLLVPKGFAHGFCTLVDNTEVLYKVDEYYSKEHDRGIYWDDPDLKIPWPTKKIIISEKDAVQPLLTQAENNF